MGVLRIDITPEEARTLVRPLVDVDLDGKPTMLYEKREFSVPIDDASVISSGTLSAWEDGLLLVPANRAAGPKDLAGMKLQQYGKSGGGGRPI